MEPRPGPVAAPLSAFARAGRAEWEARAASELGGPRALAALTRETVEGLALEPLSSAAPAFPRGAFAESGSWRSLALVEEGELERAAELVREDLAGGADGVTLPAAGLPTLAALDLDGCTVRVEPHAEPELVVPPAVADRALLLGGYDPLAALARDGAVPGGLAAALARAADHAGDETPFGVDTSVFHYAGAQPVLELACALGGVAELLRAPGLEVEDVVMGTALGFAVGRDLLLEVAKLRAARWLWSKLFAACDLEQVPQPWVHATTSRRALTRREPWTNLLRVTTAACAAALGGADSITCRPFDARLGLPDRSGRRLARNTASILACEAGLGRTADPAAGSYAVERLTDRLARAAWEVFRGIERAGGLAAGLLDGSLRARVDASWSAWSARLASGAAHVLGVSVHPAPPAEPLVREPRPPASERQGEIEPFPRRRDEDACSALSAEPAPEAGEVAP